MNVLAEIPQGLSRMLSAFKRFEGPHTSVQVSSHRLTATNINALVGRSLGRPGAKRKGASVINREIPGIEVGITATYTDSFDHVIDSILAEVRDVIQQAAKTIKDASFALCPHDTGRLESTGAFGDNSNGDTVEFLITYGPAIDPETGEDYTLFAHFGEYTIGPGTAAKNPDAGPLFLTRPMQTMSDDVFKLIVGAVQKGISRA